MSLNRVWLKLNNRTILAVKAQLGFNRRKVLDTMKGGGFKKL